MDLPVLSTLVIPPGAHAGRVALGGSPWTAGACG